MAINDGPSHVTSPKLRADFQVTLSTRAFDAARRSRPGQPGTDRAGRERNLCRAAEIATRAVGGALLGLRDATTPHAIDGTAANGRTKIAMTGTVQDPRGFVGTGLKLYLTGPDVALLFPLTGIPTSRISPDGVAGTLRHAAGHVRLTDFAGTPGSSALGGDIAVDTTAKCPIAAATPASTRVDLADFGGFIGSQPGRAGTPGQDSAQKAAVPTATSGSQFLPNAPINLPSSISPTKANGSGAGRCRSTRSRSSSTSTPAASLSIRRRCGPRSAWSMVPACSAALVGHRDGDIRLRLSGAICPPC